MSDERVTDAEVREIISNLDATVLTTPFIRAAHIMVKNVIGDLLDDGDTDDAELLKEIERWLAAHLCSIRDANTRLSSFSAGGKISLGYAVSVGQQLQATIYGQQVLLLDTTGCFASLSKAGGGPTRVRSVYVGRMPDGEHQQLDPVG